MNRWPAFYTSGSFYILFICIKRICKYKLVYLIYMHKKEFVHKMSQQYDLNQLWYWQVRSILYRQWLYHFRQPDIENIQFLLLEEYVNVQITSLSLLFLACHFPIGSSFNVVFLPLTKYLQFNTFKARVC